MGDFNVYETTIKLKFILSIFKQTTTLHNTTREDKFKLLMLGYGTCTEEVPEWARVVLYNVSVVLYYTTLALYYIIQR